MVRIAGVVLAGGRSRRMGRDKSLLRLGGERAPTLLERSLAVLRPLCAPVWVSCRTGQTFAGQCCVQDILPVSGPICGVHAALVRARAEGIPAVLVLSCDMPFMHTAMLRRLVTAAAASPPEALMTAFMAPNGWTESLAAIYRVEAARCGRPCPRSGSASSRTVRKMPVFFSISTLRRICSGRPTRRAARRKPGGKFAEIPDRA